MSRRPRHAALRALPAAALAVLLAACGAADRITEPVTNALGTFSGAVGGGVTRSIAGVAFYGQTPGTGAPGLEFGMGSLKVDKSFADVVVITRGKRDLPAPGAYAFHDFGADEDAAPEAFSIYALVAQATGGTLVCSGTQGTLTVQSASGNRVKASYSTKATCLDAAAPGREVAVTLTGTFDAVEAPVGSLPHVSAGGAPGR